MGISRRFDALGVNSVANGNKRLLLEYSCDGVSEYLNIRMFECCNTLSLNHKKGTVTSMLRLMQFKAAFRLQRAQNETRVRYRKVF